jgi:hypothetical protein
MKTLRDLLELRVISGPGTALAPSILSGSENTTRPVNAYTGSCHLSRLTSRAAIA